MKPARLTPDKAGQQRAAPQALDVGADAAAQMWFMLTADLGDPRAAASSSAKLRADRIARYGRSPSSPFGMNAWVGAVGWLDSRGGGARHRRLA